MEAACDHQHISYETSIQKYSYTLACVPTYDDICNVPVLEQNPNLELQDNEMWRERMN